LILYPVSEALPRCQEQARPELFAAERRAALELVNSPVEPLSLRVARRPLNSTAPPRRILAQLRENKIR
jgi:hypothetical protein